MFLLVAVVLERRYLDAPLVLDALYFDLNLALVKLGRLDYGNYLFGAHGGYPHVLWVVTYQFLRGLSQTSTVPMHLAILGCHVAIGWALFVMLARDSTGTAGAWTAGLVWAGATIGRYDNALLWTSNGEQAVALAWLTAAMVAMRRCRNHPRTGALLTISCAAIAGLTWGVAVGLLPVLLVQYALVERRPTEYRRRYRPCVGGLVLAIALLVGFNVLFVSQIQSQGAEVRVSAATLQHLGKMLVVPLGQLLFLPERLPTIGLGLHYLLLAVVLSCAWFAPPATRRWAGVFAALAVGYAMLIVLFRSSRELSDGRYWYVPTLGCAALLGVAAQAAAKRWRWSHKMGLACGVALLVAMAVHQDSIARRARAQFDANFNITVETIAADRALLETLAAAGRATGTPTQIPELPMMIPPFFQRTYYPLAAFVAGQFPDGLPGLEVVPPDRTSIDQLASAEALLATFDNPASGAWIARLETVTPELRSLAWLDEFGRRSEQTIALPQFYLIHPELGLELPVDQCVRFAFDRPLTRLAIRSPEAISPTEVQALLARLRAEADPEARPWEQFFAKLSDIPP